jgi:hypothetical protein
MSTCQANGCGRHTVADSGLFVGRASPLATLVVCLRTTSRRSPGLRIGERGRSPYEKRKKTQNAPGVGELYLFSFFVSFGTGDFGGGRRAGPERSRRDRAQFSVSAQGVIILTVFLLTVAVRLFTIEAILCRTMVVTPRQHDRRVVAKEMGDLMAERTCFNCLYCVCDPCRWLSLLWRDEEILPRCANHPRWPGQVHDVPGVPCRNYRPRPILPEGDGVRMIALTDGSYAYVDAADYEWLNQCTWHRENEYAVRWEKRKKVAMHRQIVPPPREMVVDHIDGNRANNCRLNLRVCTRSENSRNRRKHGGSRSMYKGVYYHKKTHKWGAKCYDRAVPICLGLFDTEVEAARAYDRKAVELFGEFARLNFPREWPPERRAAVYAPRQEPDGETKGRRSERKKARAKKTSAHAQTRGRRERKRPTKSARATGAQPERKGKRKKGEAEGRRAPPQ